MFTQIINGITLRFESTPECFSPDAADKGTLAMLLHANIRADEKVLDLGCGYGVVGCYAAKQTAPHNVTMLDISESPYAVLAKMLNITAVRTFTL